jgi:hypothetical protein
VLEGFRPFCSGESVAEDGLEEAESYLPILSNRPQSGQIAWSAPGQGRRSASTYPIRFYGEPKAPASMR